MSKHICYYDETVKAATFDCRNISLFKFIIVLYINTRADEYINKGVRQQYKGELGLTPNTLSQCLELEYVTFNENEDLAYIALQV